MNKRFYFCSISLSLLFYLIPIIYSQQKDSTSYIRRMHAQVGRKHALRRTGPDWVMYTAHLAGPEYGEAEISPRKEVVAGSVGTWTITYTAGAEGPSCTITLTMWRRKNSMSSRHSRRTTSTNTMQWHRMGSLTASAQ